MTLGRPSLAGGSLVVSRSVSAVVVAAAASAPRTDAVAALDARDLEILELLVDGLPTSQVAARLYLVAPRGSVVGAADPERPSDDGPPPDAEATRLPPRPGTRAMARPPAPR